MWIPASVAASRTKVPLGTRSSRPSMLRPTRPSSGCSGGVPVSATALRHQRRDLRPHWAAAGSAVRFEFLAEMLVGRHHEPGGRVTQWAETPAIHVRADVGEACELRASRETRFQAVHQLRFEVRSLAAGEALAA